MKPVPLFIFSLLLLLMACTSKKPAGNNPDARLADTARFYPLHNFFREQIQYVDLRNFQIYQIKTTDGVKDSTSLSKDQFIQLAGVFLQHDLSDPAVKQLYQESVFHDLGTASVTLNYTTTQPDAAVKNIDILLDESTNLVKRVFIRCQHQSGDTTIEEQCNWKANKSFQLNRTFSTPNGYRKEELNYINWNDTP
jgi:hypothetical protein